MNTNNSFSINPDTKVGALLKHYPELENVLMEMSPAFNKLKNPVLRKTVAKVATLRQVAKVGNIALADLINELRKTVNQKEYSGEEPAGDKKNIEPDWLDVSKIVASFDARQAIESGSQPINNVMSALYKLKPGEQFELITPFEPAPLIELAASKGYDSWTVRKSPDLVKTYFISKQEFNGRNHR